MLNHIEHALERIVGGVRFRLWIALYGQGWPVGRFWNVRFLVGFPFFGTYARAGGVIGID